MWLQVIHKVKVTHQGEGHIKFQVKYLHPFKFYVAHTLCKRVVCIRLKCYLLIVKNSGQFNHIMYRKRCESDPDTDAVQPHRDFLYKFALNVQ